MPEFARQMKPFSLTHRNKIIDANSLASSYVIGGIDLIRHKFRHPHNTERLPEPMMTNRQWHTPEHVWEKIPTNDC